MAVCEVNKNSNPEIVELVREIVWEQPELNRPRGGGEKVVRKGRVGKVFVELLDLGRRSSICNV